MITDQEAQGIEEILADFPKMSAHQREGMVKVLWMKAAGPETLKTMSGRRLDKDARIELAKRFEALVNGT